MNRAVCLIRQDPHYRRAAFERGLMRLGYVIHDERGVEPDERDLLVVWNLAGPAGDLATHWRARGALVLVAENGYIGTDSVGQQYYALAVNGHNGAGLWPSIGPERWQRLGVEVKPWREAGEVIVIRGQRGIGSSNMASPPGWHNVCSRDLLRLARDKRQIVQPHPGRPACHWTSVADILEALQDAYAMCIWSSAAGVRALVEGVPVFYDSPHWIAAGAAVHRYGNIDHPKRDDAARMQALHALAWAQWSVAELETGMPFDLLRGLV